MWGLLLILSQYIRVINGATAIVWFFFRFLLSFLGFGFFETIQYFFKIVFKQNQNVNDDNSINNDNECC